MAMPAPIAACVGRPRWSNLPHTADGFLAPGAIFSAALPYQQIRDERNRLFRELGSDAYNRLVTSGWLQYEGCAFPLESGLRDTAEQFLRYDAELQARNAEQFTSTPAWKPWTDDRLCEPCYPWTSARGSQQLRRSIYGDNAWKDAPTSGWMYKGVRSLPIGTDEAYRNVITCGMLKDAGLISTPEECIAEQFAAVDQFERWQWEIAHQARKSAKGNDFKIVSGWALTVIKAVSYAIAAIYAPPVAAAAVAMEVALRAATTGIGWKTAIDSAIASVNLIPVVGPVLAAALKATKSAVEYVEAVKANKAAKKEVRARAAEVERLQVELAELIQQRATLDEIRAQTALIEKQIAAGKAEMGQGGSGWIAALALLAGAALVGGRRW